MLEEKKRRDRDFLEVCERLIAELPAGEPLKLYELAARAAASPAPGYYCTIIYAERQIRKLRRQHRIGRRSRMGRQSMWDEINEKVTRIQERRPSMSLQMAVCQVISDEPASQFFISPSTARNLVYNLLRNRNEV